MGVLDRLKRASSREPDATRREPEEERHQPEIVFLGAGGARTLSSSPEAQRSFAEQVSRHVGDRMRSFIPQITAKGPVMLIMGEKAAYMAEPGQGKTLVYDGDGRSLLTEIEGLDYPGWS